MRRDSWELGTWGRIPVSMHWTVLLSAAWLYIIFMDVVATLIGAVALLLLMLAHEFGHVLVLRRRRIGVTGITLSGVHGETSYNEYAAKEGDRIAVAWAGVGAQLVVMLAALAASAFIPFNQVPLGETIWAPMAFVFVKFNVFLMIIALLPIGPFDGHDAWKILPRRRAKAKAKPKASVKPVVKAPPPPPEPESTLTEEQQRELSREAEEEAAQLIRKLTGRTDASTGDR